MGFKPTDIVDLLKAEGLDVSTVKGWKTRTGNKSRKWDPKGVLVHHTAPPNPFPLEALVEGTQGLDGNMYHIFIRATGEVIVIGVGGVAYHGGKGSGVVLDEIVAGELPTEDSALQRGLPDDSGEFNELTWGVALDHPGDGSEATKAQWKALLKVGAVFARIYGLERIRSHAQVSRRKIDPLLGSRQKMRHFRAQVARYLAENDDVAKARAEEAAARPELELKLPYIADDVVKDVQKAVNIGTLRTVTVDGVYGDETARGVSDLKLRNGWRGNDIVGPSTWELILKVIGWTP